MVESISGKISFATIRINNMSQEVINVNKKIMLYEISSQENEKEVNYLYDKLKEIRDIVAKNSNIFQYMIFSDLILRKMSKKYLYKKEEMLLILSVGKIKLDKYGEFLYVNSNKELYERLKKLRNLYAPKENIIFYKVLSKNTLKEISGRYLVNKKELLDISCIESVKYNKYGDYIINVIKKYLAEKNINSKWEEK